MIGKNSLRAALVAVTAGLLGAAPQAQAQSVANNASFGDWLVTCQAVAVNQTACRLVQTLTTNDNNNLVVRFIAVPATEGGAVLLAQVPMGVFLPGGAVFRPEGADDSAQTQMVWQSCAGQICEAAVGLTAEEVAALSETDTILFGYRMQRQGDPIIVRADVSQFAEAVAAIQP